MSQVSGAAVPLSDRPKPLDRRRVGAHGALGNRRGRSRARNRWWVSSDERSGCSEL